MVKGAEKISYQQSFTDMEYNNRKRKTKIKREELLEAMDYLIHLEEWVERVEPCYLSEKMRTGRHAVLKVYFIANMFYLRRKSRRGNVRQLWLS